MSKTEAFPHQAEVLAQIKDLSYFAIWWEPGCGKTKIMLDVLEHKYLSGQVEACLVLAPNSVFTNYETQEIPRHLGIQHRVFTYRTNKAATKSAKLARTAILAKDATRCAIALMSYDSICTAAGFDFAERFVSVHSTLVIADEGTAIKSAGAVRTKKAKAIGKLATARLIATGTPACESPFDLYSQIQFLDPLFWKRHGMGSQWVFQQEFATFLRRKFGARSFNELQSYRNIDKLNKLISPISSRFLKEDLAHSLPPKLYSTRQFQMTSAQQAVYDELKSEYTVMIDGQHVDAALAIVRLGRLQQVTSGYIGGLADGGTKEIIAPADNPRLRLLLDTIAECPHKVIVWCRFTRDVEIICQALGDEAVRYDGSTSLDDREAHLNAFRDPQSKAKVLVANIQAISQGVTLTIAKTMIYYSNSFSLEKRLQSEDRNHRIGQDAKSVHIIDLVATDSVDSYITEALQKKFDIASQVTGDRLREWLRATPPITQDHLIISAEERL